MPRFLIVSILLLILSVGGCDSIEDGRYAVDVIEVQATQSTEGASSFAVRLRNAGAASLSRVDIRFTLHPQDQLKSGVSTAVLAPGTETTVEVRLLHVTTHDAYECYTSWLAAFAPGKLDAVLDRPGPTTCD